VIHSENYVKTKQIGFNIVELSSQSETDKFLLELGSRTDESISWRYNTTKLGGTAVQKIVYKRNV